jgi:hypothetical protein
VSTLSLARLGLWLARVAVLLIILAIGAAIAFGVSKLSYPTVYTRPDSDTSVGKADVDQSNGTVTVTLSNDAAVRIGIQTAPVQPSTSGPAGTIVIPAGAVFYDAAGDTWTYVATQPLVFVRQHITVVSIRDRIALLSQGPPVDSQVVTVGAAELYGTEVGVGEE